MSNHFSYTWLQVSNAVAFKTAELMKASDDADVRDAGVRLMREHQKHNSELAHRIAAKAKQIYPETKVLGIDCSPMVDPYPECGEAQVLAWVSVPWTQAEHDEAIEDGEGY